MTLLDWSTVWSLIHVFVLNALLYEPRLPKKKAVILTVCLMGPLAAYNAWFFVHFGNELAGQLVLFNCTIPSLIFFMLMAKHRNGRLLFTFCLSDTISLEIICITRLIDDAIGLPDFWVLFILRLIVWPMLEFVVIKWLRKPYLVLQNAVQKGWGGFAAITLLFYVILVVMSSYPTVIQNRLEELPALLLVMALMPLIYWNILTTLFRQQELHETKQKEQLLQVQTAMLKQRIEQTLEAENQISIHRHDLHHQLQVIKTMLESGEIHEAQDYIEASQETLNGTKSRHWCLHPVLDAVFSAYFQQADSKGIKVEADIDIPADIPVNAVELSTVFANALENAIHAVSDLPQEHRVIRCRCIWQPQLMFYVSNPYAGEVRFDENDRPVAESTMHGIGTRSIAAYCEKYGAVCRYSAEDGWFSIKIAQTIWTE